LPDPPGARDADEGVGHGRPEAEARPWLAALQERCKACGLARHPATTRLVDGQDEDRRGASPATRVDVRGYTCRPRRATHRDGTFGVRFTPGVSHEAAPDRRQRMHAWRLQLKPDQSWEDLSRMCHPVRRGGIHDDGGVDTSALDPTLRPMHGAVVHGVRRQDTRLNRHRRRAEYWRGRVARREPTRLAHWPRGSTPTAG
jgi:RNA-directed DNA polymerase